MKMLTFFAIMSLSVSAFAGKARLSCTNDKGSILIDDNSVTMEIKNVAGNEDLKNYYKNKMLGDMAVNHVAINPFKLKIKKNMKCAQAFEKLINCNSKSTKGRLDIGVQVSISGGYSSMSTSADHKIENFELNTSVGAAGPISIGSGTTTVALDQVSVKTEAQIKVDGQFVAVELEQNFASSDCK